MDIKTQKTELRAAYLAKRASLPPEEKRHATAKFAMRCLPPPLSAMRKPYLPSHRARARWISALFSVPHFHRESGLPFPVARRAI